MEAYTSFAQVYDLFMDNVPYEDWTDYVVSILEENGITSGDICDLGCGTGKITRLLAARGYNMLGVDLSVDMLSLAAQKDCENILYLCQDMSELELHKQVDAMISICDSMNYLLEKEDILHTFCQVREYLKDGGIFVFDLNTIYKYETIIGERTICENRDEGSFIWENYYHPENQINEYDLTLFIRQQDGRYQKFEETHYQRGYEIEQIQSLAKEAKMHWIGCYQELSREEPDNMSERIYIVLKKEGK